MADFDFKAATPDGSVSVTGYLFGADSQAAAEPSIYLISNIKAAFIGAGDISVALGKTLTVSNTMTFTATDSSSIAFGAGGTVAYTSNKLSAFAATTSAELAGVISDETGTGALVFANSPTLVTPLLGTPTSGLLTNCTGLPVGAVTGLGTGVGTFLATPSSANLAAAVTDETGSGALVFATSPTLVTPAIGTPSSGTLTSCTGLPISTGVSGLGTGVATALAVNVGSAGAPVVNGGALGTPSSGTLTNATGLPISTGVSGLGTGIATFLATPSSANLASAVTDETGSGALVFASAIRTKLAADTTFYMRTDGSDSNTGTANTAGGAFLTLAGALAKISANYDFGGYTVYLQIADGTYSDTYVNVPVMVGNKGPTGLVIQGNATTPSNVVLAGAAASAGVGTIFASVAGACCTVKNLKMTNTAGAAAHINAQSGGQIYFYNMVFGTTAANGSAIYVFGAGSYITNQDETLTYGGSEIAIGTSNYVLNAQTGGTIALYGGTWNSTTANTLSYFAFASVGGIIDTSGCTFSVSGAGSYTGQRFICQNDGLINTYGAGVNYFPGTVAGDPATSTKGSYS